MLEKFSEQARRAHYWTSFSPEKRGDSLISEFSQQLKEDIEELEKGGAGSEEISSYKERYERYFSSWLGAKSRCASSMIAGPSNFPVRRAEKANRSERNHYEVFQEWRKRAIKSIIRKAQPEKTFSSELERYRADLASRVAMQEKCKEANKIIRSKTCEAEKVERLVALLGISDQKAISLMEPDFCGRVGFASYVMTNNLANIKRIQERINELEKKESVSVAVGEKEIEFEGGVLVLNYSEDRVQIKFPGKPEEAVRTELKRNGFRWAPSQEAWQRQLTYNGLRSASSFTKIPMEKLK